MASSDSDSTIGSTIPSEVALPKSRRKKPKQLYEAYYERLKNRQQTVPYSKLDNRKVFPTEFTSAESVLSALKPNWYAPGSGECRHSTVDYAPLSRGQDSHQTIEMGDEEDVQLPRSFMTCEIDWDSELEEADYGTDVVVISESEPDGVASHMSWAKTESQRSTGKFSSKGLIPRQETATVSKEELKVSSQRSTRTAQQVDRSRTDVVRDIGDDDLNSQFLSELAKLSQRRASTKQLQKLYQEKLLNVEARKKAPKKVIGHAWRSHDPAALELMRRSTVEPIRGASPYTRKSFNSKTSSHGSEGDTESLRSGMLFVKRITRELGSTDLRKHMVITTETMNEFCVQNPNKTMDLVLQGKEVYTKLGRRIQDFDLPYIFSYLIVNSDVVNLDLSYNEITKTGAWYIMDFLSWNSTLRGLNLMNNDIDGLDSHMINAICQNQTLKSLRLNGNPLGKQGGEYIAFLLMFKELELLDMGQTDQTIQSLAWISQALMQVESLKVLDLSRILGYPGYVCDSLHFALAFSDILRFCSSLVELHLQKNNLTDIDVEQLLFGFSFNKTLELLDLGCNHIGDSGAEMLANALQCGAPLKALMVATNRIGNQGARSLSLKLPFSQIKMLDIADNRISDQGIIDIVQTIKKPYPLMALFIFGNHLSARSMEVIQAQFSKGQLSPETLDIVLYYIDGVLGCGRNTATNRYRARYYRVENEGRCRTTTSCKRKPRKDAPSKKPGCLKYEYHNLVNVRDELNNSSNYSLLGPACPV